MDSICIVEESGGSYDSAYTNVILVFATQEEGDKAVEALEAEMKLLEKLEPAANRFNKVWTQGQHRAEDRNPMWETAQKDFDADVRAICKVYPYEHEMPDGRKIISLPDFRDGVDFTAYTMKLSVVA